MTCPHCQAQVPASLFAIRRDVLGRERPGECPECGEFVRRSCAGVGDHVHRRGCRCITDRFDVPRSEDCREWAEPGEDRCVECEGVARDAARAEEYVTGGI